MHPPRKGFPRGIACDVTERLLPLFPLPLVLFPGVPLPLHIFEPRYRKLTKDVLEGDKLLAMAFQLLLVARLPAHATSTGTGRGFPLLRVMVTADHRGRESRVSTERPRRYQCSRCRLQRRLPGRQGQR